MIFVNVEIGLFVLCALIIIYMIIWHRPASLCPFILHYWVRQPDGEVNCGMGGTEKARFHICLNCRLEKITTQDRYGKYTWSTLHPAAVPTEQKE